MHRSRRITAVRRALTASLLSVSLCAHAQSSSASAQKVDEGLWTQVDLNEVPAPVVTSAAKPIGATPVPAVDATKVPPIKAKPAGAAEQRPRASAEHRKPHLSVGPTAPLIKVTASVVPAIELLMPVTQPVVAPKPVEIKPVEAKLPPSYALTVKDRTIQGGLQRWAALAGWKLSWELPEGTQGGQVRFDADFGADFDVALSKLAAAMRGETKVHAYLYANNKVLRIVEEPAKPVVSPAVPMTPTVEGLQKDSADRGLPHVTRVKGYWLGATGTETEDTPTAALPRIFNASVSLVFSDTANLGTVVGILTKVTGVHIALPGAIEYPAAKLFVNDAVLGSKPDSKKKPAALKGKLTYIGTPKELLDRMSVSTGLLWEFKDDTIVFSE